MKVTVIHGPNLNLLGSRQPEIYGSDTLDDLTARIAAWGSAMGVETSFLQSNSESEIVSLIQGSGENADAVLLNVGGFTHTSVAIADAVASVQIPTIEVHLSDINSREPWRRRSLIAGPAIRQITGRGGTGYRDALRHLINRSEVPFDTIRYGPHDDHIADVRGPRSESPVLVMLVHGGFWSNVWERDSTESIAVALAHHGIASVNIEYRRTSTWPDSGQDTLMALRSLEGDGRRLVVLGHSAGGYTGMWAANRLGVDFVGLAPITSLEDIAGSSKAVDSLIESGAPLRLEASMPKALFLHGGADNLVPPDQSTRLTQSSDVRIYDDLGHFDLLDPAKRHWPDVLDFLGGTQPN